MGINSVYVVFKGRKTDMCYSWLECQAQVDGFLGSSYQKFKSTDEAYKAITTYVHPQNSIESLEENVSEKVQSTEKETKANPRVFLDLNIDGDPVGRLVIELFTDSTPITAENFRALCIGEKGLGRKKMPLHYKGTTLHRVIPKSMFKGGDITKEDGLGGESIYGDTFAKENFVNKHIGLGILFMANTGPGTNGSQFLICTTKTEWLEEKNVVFSQVIKGFDVMKVIEKVGPRFGLTSKPVVVTNCGQLS